MAKIAAEKSPANAAIAGERRMTVVGLAGDDAPIAFDPALVAAVEPKPDGGCRLHLAGGQTLTLRPAAAGEALKLLGLGQLARATKPRETPRPKRKPKPAAERPTLWQEFVAIWHSR